MDRHGRSLRLNAECQALVDELRACGAITQERFSTAVWLAFVRARPGVVAELLGELRYAQARYQVGNPGAWMMDKWRRWGRPDQ